MRIRAVALDVDGVLTDGAVWWGAGGEELEALPLPRCHGDFTAPSVEAVRFALISGEDSPLVTRFAEKLGIADVFIGCKDKARALTEFAKRHDLALAEVCFMGDDVNDVAALMIAGTSAAPANAHYTARGAGVDSDRRRRWQRRGTRAPGQAGARRSPNVGLRHAHRGGMKLSDYVMQTIARAGVKHVFMLPGGGAMHLNDSLGRCEGLEYICNLHEQAVGHCRRGVCAGHQ